MAQSRLKRDGTTTPQISQEPVFLQLSDDGRPRDPQHACGARLVVVGKSHGGGEELARANSKGKEAMMGSMINPPKAARQKVPGFMAERVRMLLNDPKIVSALTR